MNGVANSRVVSRYGDWNTFSKIELVDKVLTTKKEMAESRKFLYLELFGSEEGTVRSDDSMRMAELECRMLADYRNYLALNLCFLEILPEELMMAICKYLDLGNVLSLSMCDRHLKNLLCDELSESKRRAARNKYQSALDYGGVYVRSLICTYSFVLRLPKDELKMIRSEANVDADVFGGECDERFSVPESPEFSDACVPYVKKRRNRRKNKNGSDSVCRICKKPGHSPSECWFRTDVSEYEGNSIPRPCGVCGKIGHRTDKCRFAKEGSKESERSVPTYVSIVKREATSQNKIK